MRQGDGLYSTCQQAVPWGGAASWVLPAASLNARFDCAYSNGLILYHCGHPATWNNNAAAFFDHISGRTEIWYVGFGSLYTYHYLQERGVVSAERRQPILATVSPVIMVQIQLPANWCTPEG